MPQLQPAVVGRHVWDRTRAAARDVFPLMPMAERADDVWQRREVRRLRGVEDAGVRALGPDGPLATATVAVVIPTFRRRELLRHAVASVLAQTRSDLCAIVVDDGGGEADGLPADPRLMVVRLPANTRCLGLVRNTGLRLTESPFVAFLDDDNTWDPRHLEVTLAPLESGAADLVYSSLEVVDEHGAVVRVQGDPWDRRAMSHRNHVDANSIVARRTPDVRFSVLPRRKGSWRMEDWELAWRVSARGRVQHVDEVTVRYLVNPTSFYSRNENQLA